jgi:DNA polymerase-3 subunit delta
LIYPGRIRRTSALVKFFSSFSNAVEVTEMKPLKGRGLENWLVNRFRTEGSVPDQDAVARLIDLVGSDLRLLDMEVRKLITFVGDKRRIERDDVDQASGWIKSYVEWELTNQLEQANYRECLLVVENLMRKEDVKDTQVLALVTGFFRNLLLVKLRLSEGVKPRKQIFSEVKPQIKESFRGLYDTQFRQLFSLAEAFSLEDLRYILSRLSDVDLKMKSSGLSFQTLLEAFLFEYCWMRKYGRSA